MMIGRHTIAVVIVVAASASTATPAEAAPPVEPPMAVTGSEELPPPPTDRVEPEEPALEPGVIDDHGPDALAERLRAFDDHLLRGRQAARAGDHAAAEAEFSAALRLQYNDSSALVGRAHARYAQTGPDQCPEGAIADLQELERHDPKGAWLEQRAELLAWMDRCGAAFARQRSLLVRSLAAEPPGARGRPDDIRVLLARLYLEQGRSANGSLSNPQIHAALAELERYREESAKAQQVPSIEALELQAELYRELGLQREAAGAYEALLELHPQSPAVEDWRFELELLTLEGTQGYRPTPAAEAAYERGIAALERGELEVAARSLQQAIDDSPWFPRAHYARGSVHARLGKPLEAVEDLKRAARMDRSDYRPHLMLGMIYKKEFGGAQNDEAILHLEAALRLRPDLHRIHLLLGELYAARDRQQARQHYQRYIDAASFDDVDAVAARRALEELDRDTRRDAPVIQPPPRETLRLLDPELQRMINEAYLRGLEQNDWTTAESILLAAKSRFVREPTVYNELARVVYAQNRRDEARSYWRASLALQEDQGEVHERLGLDLRADEPALAAEHLLRAAELGSPIARFLAAELLWEHARPFAAVAQLDRYLVEASEYDLGWERAVRLRAQMKRRFTQIYGVAGAALLLLLAVPMWRLVRRFRGKSLAQLLARRPKSYPDVARVVSLIRHEILKHNTAFLRDVGEALERDEPQADVRAAVLAQRLFGAPPRRLRSSPPEGVYGRLLGYIGSLEDIARAHGVRLNLRRKDPAFRPILATFERLAERAPHLRRCARLSRHKQRVLGRELQRAGQRLGRDAFVELSRLLEQLCIVKVDATLCEEVFAQVCGEIPFSALDVEPLQVSGESASIRVFRTDLEDIIANVMRNSLQSSASFGSVPLGLAVELAIEHDPITGLESLAIRIKDRSGEPLTEEMLRGRHVERGMGITVDLLSRYDGSISVEPETGGWKKAVVLRFFVVETILTDAREEGGVAA